MFMSEIQSSSSSGISAWARVSRWPARPSSAGRISRANVGSRRRREGSLIVSMSRSVTGTAGRGMLIWIARMPLGARQSPSVRPRTATAPRASESSLPCQPLVPPGVGATSARRSRSAGSVASRAHPQKSASPESQMVPVGSSASVSYTVTTTKSPSGVIDAWLDGNVCVTNTGGADTQGLAISDQLTKPPLKSVLSTVAVDMGAKPVLAPGDSWCYPFRISVPTASVVVGAKYKDSAEVTITNHNGHLGVPTGPTPSATAALPLSPTVVDGSITVDDNSIGRAFDFGTSGTENYVEGFSCDAAAGPRQWSRTIPRRSRAPVSTRAPKRRSTAELRPRCPRPFQRGRSAREQASPTRRRSRAPKRRRAAR